MISFVVPTYNRAHTVEGTITSVLAQPYKQSEIVIVDDGSTDCLSEVIDKFKGDPRVQYIRLPNNQGQNVARNVGINAAHGEIVTIIDSDDEDLGLDLAQVADRFYDHPELVGLFTGTVSKSTGRLLGVMDRAGVIFGLEGFLDGTYRGEYQPFLRKAYLKQPVFEEGLGIKRTCTHLTWLKLAQQFKFKILNVTTRLYGDTGSDRMGNLENIFRDAHEILQCNHLVLERYGQAIAKISPRAYAELSLNKAYYALLAYGRVEGWKVLKTVNMVDASNGRYFTVLVCLAIGPQLVRTFRRLLG